MKNINIISKKGKINIFLSDMSLDLDFFSKNIQTQKQEVELEEDSLIEPSLDSDLSLFYTKNRDKNLGTYLSTNKWKQTKCILFFTKSTTTNLFINGQKFFYSQKYNSASELFFNSLKLALKLIGPFSLDSIVRGGGLTSQFSALNFAFLRIFSLKFPSKKEIFFKALNLIVLSKKKERKKFGFKKARKKFQYSKR